jgi:hypothetical protein
VKLLTTNLSAEGVQCMWLLPQAMPTGDDVFVLEFRRIALGFSWDMAAHVCVMGERVFRHRDKEEVLYYVLDEKVVPSAHMVDGHLLVLKDRYRAVAVCGPDRPADMIMTLRAKDGLGHYAEDSNPAIARSLWPSFRDFDTTASMRFVPPPDENVVHGDLERLLAERPIDPQTDMLMVDKEKNALTRVLFPADLEVKATQAGISHGQILPATALWMAHRGLQGGMSYQKKANSHTHKPGIGGY